MPSESNPKTVAARYRPARADLRELAIARKVIAGLAHPDTRLIADTAMGTLLAALSGGGLQVSKIPGLQQAIRKHVRQAWMDGVIAPLARSRHPADRAVLDALPQAFALSAHAQVASAVERIGRSIPEGAGGTRDHVARACTYLRTLPVILQALSDLEAAPRMAGRAGGLLPEDVGADLAGAAATARRRLKAALAAGLPALVDGLAEDVYRVPLRASDAPALRWTTVALSAPPPRGARRSDRGAARWRRGLAIAIARDLVDEALEPAACRMLGRHAGLEVGDAAYAAAGDHAGRLALRLSRGGVILSLSVHFDIGAGRFEQSAVAAPPDGGPRPLAPAEVDALLDATIPAALDTPAHRAMRHLSRRAEPSGLRMAVIEGDELLVAADTSGKQDTLLLADLVRTADAEGVAVRFVPGRDMVLAADLIEMGFDWVEDATGRNLTRMPAEPTVRPGR